MNWILRCLGTTALVSTVFLTSGLSSSPLMLGEKTEANFGNRKGNSQLFTPLSDGWPDTIPCVPPFNCCAPPYC